MGKPDWPSSTTARSPHKIFDGLRGPLFDDFREVACLICLTQRAAIWKRPRDIRVASGRVIASRHCLLDKNQSLCAVR